MKNKKAKMTTTLRVTYERDESGHWIAEVEEAHGVQGVHSNGRSIAAARRRVREALDLTIVADGLDLGDVRLEEEIRVPGHTDSIRAVRAAQLELEDYARRMKMARDIQAKVAEELERAGLSQRDVGEILGRSHETVRRRTRQADA